MLLADLAHEAEQAGGEPLDSVFFGGGTPSLMPPALVASLLAAAERPVLILGSDVWNDHAEGAAVRLAETLQVPVIPNGMGRGVVPSGHPLLVTRARSHALKNADLVVVVGTPLDFRLGYGKFGPAEAPAEVAHIVDHPDQISHHAKPAAAVGGALGQTLDSITESWEKHPTHRQRDEWLAALQGQAAAAVAADAEVLTSTLDPIHPARIYGELNKRLADRKIVVQPSEDSRQWLATTGYDPVFGARPLKRLIQREIENPLALQMLEGKFVDGDTILVNVDTEEDCLDFEKGERVKDEAEENKKEEAETTKEESKETATEADKK